MKLLKRYSKQSTAKAALFVECLSHMAMASPRTCPNETFYDYTLEWLTN